MDALERGRRPRHFPCMKIIIQPPGPRQGADIDMNADGTFVDPPAPSVAERVLRAAIIAAVLAAGLAIAMLALWFALILIPVAIGAALVAWAAWRWRVWRG